MRRLSLLVVVSIVALASIGCKGGGGGGFSERTAKGKENVFRYPIPDEPTTLDPGLVQDGDTIDALQQVFEGLVGWSEDNQVEGRLAEKWDIEDGGKTYVFHLRKGVKFHNGREVTADDIKWSIERNTSAALASPNWQYVGDIVGVKDHHDGKTDTISGIEVRDPSTIVIKIDKPRPYFLGKLTYLISGVVAKEAVPADGPMTDIKQMVGTGPFKAAQYERSQILALDANKDYWGGAPSIDRIERPIIKDPATRLNKYKSGEIDLVSLERQDLDAIKKDDKLSKDLKPFDRPSIWYVGLNQHSYPPFKDKRVRQAFAMAIDKDRIVNDILGGANNIANGIVPPGVTGHRDQTMAIKFDPEGARKLLADAGYPGGKGLPPIEMNFRDARPDIRIVAEAVQGMLQTNLGVTINTRMMEWGAYLDKWNKGDVQFFHMRWAADYLDAENFLSYMLATYGPENHIGYSNAEFDALCTQADTIMDWDQRAPLYAKAEDIVLQDAPWVPIYFQRDYELISPRVSGLRESLFGHLPHTKVRLAAN
jgi:ABC-type transport system substrate-binding protein